jgi:hypothetical protein
MARYIPGNVSNAELKAELDKIAQAMETPNQFLFLDPQFAVPKKLREGLVVMAKAPWNPGSGDGVYAYRGGAWRFLG